MNIAYSTMCEIVNSTDSKKGSNEVAHQ